MQFKNVSLAYNKRNVLKNISLDIKPGEFVFLIGASGSGKTSLINSIIGSKKISQGEIIDDAGNNLSKMSAKKMLQYRRKMGVIFQDFKLLSKKTVYENVAFAMEVCGYSNKDIRKRIPEVLSQVGLLAKKDKFIETLSGGEIQRTGIARALIHHPQIIIGDEPTGNLDKHNALEVMYLLDTLNQQGKTIIIATHDETIVNIMKKRVIAFQDGKIISDQKCGNYCL
ncbi:ATP-binding cassette domain-containing protein [Candidatus Gracilibacteria bacterium]|nr:ATP-binding cassette domain-containing protein [Candidatus Gracilibacteria bacterium]